VIMHNRLEAEPCPHCEFVTPENLTMTISGGPVHCVTKLPFKEGGEDWHNDNTPVVRYQPVRNNWSAVLWGAFWFCGGGWLGFLFAMWLESGR